MGLALCFALVLSFCAPAFAADRPIDSSDLKGISPKRHRYIFSVLGGAAVGAGIGALLGGGNDITKGVMVGAGGASFAYLHSNRNDNLNGWRSWALIGGNAVLGSGLGWTICGCDDGAVAGALIGGGGTAIYQTMEQRRRPRTARTGRNP